MDPDAAAKEAIAAGLTEEVSLLKKKIHLSEGQRRAEYEEFDAEKKRLTNKIRNIKKELREINTTRPSKYVDAELLKKSGKPLKKLKAYLGKTPEDVEQILDLQCIDLKKKLDLLKYEIAKKNERLSGCIKEVNELKTENSTETIMLIHPTESNVTKLENKIHETSLHLQEMRHMEKKYTKMRQSLLDDRVFFQSTLDKYEEEIAKQAKEIQHLESVRDEAVRLRDKTKRKLSRLESLVIAQGVERERELRELKKKVEEGRAYLERVERSLVPSGNKGIQHQDSGEVEGDGLSTEQVAKEALLAKLQKLKEVTGAKDEEDILVKLKSQKETKERLLKLKTTIENEKKKVELKKEQLEAELEAVKFSEVKEKERNEEEIERIEKLIEEAESAADEQAVLYEGEKIKLTEVRNYLLYFREMLDILAGDSKAGPKREEIYNDAVSLLAKSMEDFNKLLEQAKTANLTHYFEEPVEDLFIKELSKMEIGKRHEGESNMEKIIDEITDIPTREFLKRQAQLIVEAQGKRKGGYPKDMPSSFR